MADEKKYFVHVEETETGLSIKSNAPTPVVLEMLNMTVGQVQKDFVTQVETILQEQAQEEQAPAIVH